MQKSFLSKLLLVFILFFSFGVASSFAATVNMVTKYGQTGGLKGILNTTSSVVNGINICPNNNTNANGTPGCDMSSDAGFNDGGTPSQGDDDSYSGDLIVRTNDSFEIIAGWNWGNNDGDGEEKVTITSTLPGNGVYEWDGIPGSCNQSESSISDDGQTIICVRKDFDVNDVGSYSEDLPFSVRVRGGTPNGTQAGDISFTISSKNAQDKSDDTNNTSLIVTASPRWNLQKSYYTRSAGYTHNGVKGFLIYYKYYIEVDEVSGETDNAAGALGNESLGTDATIDFTDDLSSVAPNAELVSCEADTLGSLNGGDPYHAYYSTHPERSVATPDGVQDITCTQANAGENISINIKHLDASLNHYPTQRYNGNPLPVNRYIAAIGIIRVFIPLTDVENGPDGASGTADDGSLPTSNKLTNFDPNGISGTSNFGNSTESDKDNKYNLTLYATSGSFSKGYTTESGQHVYTPGGAAGRRAGNGVFTAGAVWGTRLIYNNLGGTDFENVKMCDVVDANRMEIIPVGSYRKLNDYFAGYMGGGGDVNKWEYEYSSTYVDDSWLASNGGDTSVVHGDEVRTECYTENSAGNTIWFDNPQDALNNPNGLGVITKVRIKTKAGEVLAPGEYFYVWISHKVRDKDLSGNSNAPGTFMNNYASVKDDNYYTSGYSPSYIPNDINTAPVGYGGDRIMLTRGKVRILKDANLTNVSPGDTVTFSLNASLTTDVPNSGQEQVVIKDMLPDGVSYVGGTTSGASEPVIGTCADVAELSETCDDNKNTVLIWDLGNRTVNQAIDTISYDTLITASAPAGVAENYALIQSPGDISPVSQRKVNRNLNITVPSSLIISKSVESEVLVEKNISPVHFKVSLRNGKTSGNLTNLDVIDVLPFNGDNIQGIPFTVGSTTVIRHRNPATSFSGTLEFLDATLTGDCTGSPTYYFTKDVASTVDLSPTGSNNTDNGNVTSNWCAGTSVGPDAGCGFTNAEVTAVRVRGTDIAADKMCYLDVKMNVSGNNKDDIYTNSAGAFAEGVSNAVLSNDVFVKVVASSIGNKVWFDSNKDGIQDSSENSASGITVQLLDENDNLLKTTITDSNGNYLFDELNSGNYKIKVIKPDNATGFSPKDNIGDDSKDSDVDSNGVTSIISLAKSTDIYNQDIGLLSMDLGGTIWEDSNDNGLLDNGETTKNGVEVKLYKDTNGDGVYDAGDELVDTQNTDASGNYKFENLMEGDYVVVLSESNFGAGGIIEGFISSDDSIITDPNSDTKNDDNGIQNGNFISTKSITLSDSNEPTNDGDGNNSNLTLDLGVYKKVSLGDKIWIDANADGIQDAGELGFSGAVVKLLDSVGNIISTGSTDNNGNYLFENLNPGDYSVEIELPTDYILSAKDNGNDELDSDFDTTTLKTDSITLVSNQDNLTLDAGIYKKASLGDKIWIDANADGIQDAGELGFSGATVKLLNNSGNEIATTTTDASGNYLFENLIPGEYKVEIVLPNNHNLNPKSVGGDNQKDSDFNTDLKTDTITLVSGQNERGIDAGIYEKASLGDKVWIDSNTDGIQDAGEQGLAGVVVKLLDNSGNEITTTTTDANGNYLFENLIPGEYKVEIVIPSDYYLSEKSEGADTAKDSDINTNLKTDTITLVSAENNLDIDAGLYKKSHIGDKVWFDTNKDGIQDAGEDPIVGTTVNLLDENGNIITSTTTSGTGEYGFDVVPGKYIVEFITPTGYIRTTKGAGNNDNNSDADKTTGKTDIINVGYDENIDNIDAGMYVPTGSVGDKVWIDSNADGIQDAGEQGQSGVKVELLNASGAVISTTTTDASGNYLFTDVVAGDYKIKFSDLPDDYKFSPKNTGTEGNDSNADLNSGETDIFTLNDKDYNLTIDAGIYTVASLGDIVWNDIDKDGEQDAGETGIEGVVVNLLDENGNQVATTTTDANGNYLFENLEPNKYIVEFVKPSTYVGSPKTNISDTEKDSNADKTTGKTEIITLVSAENNLSVDAGMYIPTGSVGDKVWIDLNADGKQDAGEAGLEGVVVKLLDNAGNEVASTTTDSNGNYLFEDVVAGDYKIKFITKEGYVFSPKTAGDNTDVDSNSDATSGETDIFTVEDKDEIRDIDSGMYVPAILSGKVVNDINKNAIKDNEDINLENVVVKLLNSNGEVISTTNTNSDGEYKFEGIVPGNYIVEIVRPTKFNRISSKDVGSDDNSDFDIDGNGKTVSIYLANGEKKRNVDAGFYKRSSGGGGYIQNIRCKKTHLECRKENGIYKFFRKTNITCSGGNLGKICKEEKKQEIKKEELKEIKKEETKKEVKKQEPKETKKQEENKIKNQEPKINISEEKTRLKKEFERLQEKQKLLKELLEQKQVKQNFVLPKILPQTGTPIEKRTFRRNVGSIETKLPNKEVFRLAGSKNTDLNYWKQVLASQDQNKNEYIVVPSNGLVIPVNSIPKVTTDFTKMVSGQEIHVNDYLKTGVMEYPNTGELGKAGNKVIFGHSSYWKKDDGRYKTHFGKIIELDPGEEVWVYKKENGKFKRYIYKVTKSYNTKAKDVGVLKPTQDSTLTLFTCTPIGGIAGRWIIRAKYVGDYEKQQRITKLKEELYGTNVALKYRKVINKIVNVLIKDKIKKDEKIINLYNKLDKLEVKYKKVTKIRNIIKYFKIKLLEKLF